MVTGLKRGGMDHTDTQFYLGCRSHEEKKLTVMWLFEGGTEETEQRKCQSSRDLKNDHKLARRGLKRVRQKVPHKQGQKDTLL